MTGLDRVRDAARIEEAELTAQAILTAFQQSGRGNIRLKIDRRDIFETGEMRGDLDERVYFSALQPLMRRILPTPDRQDVHDEQIRQVFRRPRVEFAKLLDQFIQSSRGWPMLLGEFYAGPLHQLVRSALTRPERATPIAIFHRGELSEAFTVYRNSRNEPRVLAHHLMSEFEKVLGRDYGRHRSMAYFEGLPLPQFMGDIEALALARNRGEPEYRILDVQSLLLEEALTGRFLPEVNPVLLRSFLNQGSPERETFLKQLIPYYSRPASEGVRMEFRDFLLGYLTPYEMANAAALRQDPLYRLMEDDPNALSLIVRGRYFFDNNGSTKPDANGGGGSSLPPVP